MARPLYTALLVLNHSTSEWIFPRRKIVAGKMLRSPRNCWRFAVIVPSKGKSGWSSVHSAVSILRRAVVLTSFLLAIYSGCYTQCAVPSLPRWPPDCVVVWAEYNIAAIAVFEFSGRTTFPRPANWSGLPNLVSDYRRYFPSRPTSMV